MIKPTYATLKVKGGWQWSRKEKDLLRKWRDLPTSVIAERLHRTQNAVTVNFGYLHISRVFIRKLACQKWYRIKAAEKAKHLRGKKIRLRSNTVAQYTGNSIGRMTASQAYRYLPELKCNYKGHLFSCGSHSDKPVFCSKCWSEEGARNWEKLQLQSRRFGLNIDDLRLKRDKQRNRHGQVCCAICLIHENGKLLAIDHNHKYHQKSGKGYRGLVCPACNWLIAYVENDIKLGPLFKPLERRVKKYLASYK